MSKKPTSHATQAKHNQFDRSKGPTPIRMWTSTYTYGHVWELTFEQFADNSLLVTACKSGKVAYHLVGWEIPRRVDPSKTSLRLVVESTYMVHTTWDEHYCIRAEVVKQYREFISKEPPLDKYDMTGGTDE